MREARSSLGRCIGRWKSSEFWQKGSEYEVVEWPSNQEIMSPISFFSSQLLNFKQWQAMTTLSNDMFLLKLFNNDKQWHVPSKIDQDTATTLFEFLVLISTADTVNDGPEPDRFDRVDNNTAIISGSSSGVSGSSSGVSGSNSSRSSNTSSRKGASIVKRRSSCLSLSMKWYWDWDNTSSSNSIRLTCMTAIKCLLLLLSIEICECAKTHGWIIPTYFHQKPMRSSGDFLNSNIQRSNSCELYSSQSYYTKTNQTSRFRRAVRAERCDVADAPGVYTENFQSFTGANIWGLLLPAAAAAAAAAVFNVLFMKQYFYGQACSTSYASPRVKENASGVLRGEWQEWYCQSSLPFVVILNIPVFIAAVMCHIYITTSIQKNTNNAKKMVNELKKWYLTCNKWKWKCIAIRYSTPLCFLSPQLIIISWHQSYPLLVG